VVSADPLAGRALVRSLMSQIGIAVTGRSISNQDVGPALDQAPADVLLIDAGMSGPAEETWADLPLPALWLVTSSEAAAQALRLGAGGVLKREAEPPVLASALRSVFQSLVVLEPTFLAPLLTLEPPSAAPIDELTKREREVLELLARGLSNKGIAEALKISDHTVKFHVNALLSKLGAQSRTEVVVRAARRGWLSL
jgi:DNA-binding NarL/FixJ family response regulator